LSKCILKSRLLKDYFSIKISLHNYDSLADLMEHVQNLCNNLDLIIQDHDSMCKIFPTTFKKSARTWYNKPNFIEGFSDLYAKLVARFSTGILAKKTSTKLFSVAQQENEYTQVLRRFNAEMLKVEELFEL